MNMSTDLDLSHKTATVWPEEKMDASMTCRVGSLQAPLLSVLLCLGYPHPPTTGEWADDRVLMEWRFRDRRGGPVDRLRLEGVC